MKLAGPLQQVVKMKNLEMAALILLITGVLAFTLWLWILPTWENILLIPGPQNRSSSQIEFAKTVATIIVALGVSVTLYLTWRRVTAAERTIEVAQEGQITERFYAGHRPTRQRQSVDPLGGDLCSGADRQRLCRRSLASDAGAHGLRP